MKRVFRGYVPKDYDFFHNILFSLIDSDGHGLEEYMKGRYNSDGQGFKVTITVDRTTKDSNKNGHWILLKQ